MSNHEDVGKTLAAGESMTIRTPFTALEEDLRHVTKTVRKGDGKATAPVVSLDADGVVKNLIRQRDTVNKLFNEMIAMASQYRRECDAFIQRVNDIMHEKVEQ
jgi:hypothetical protein